MSQRRGFTLIELVMTIMILAIIAVPLALTVSRYIESTFESTDYTIAQQLAGLEMEVINNINTQSQYDSLTAGTTTIFNYRGYNYDIITNIAFVHGTRTTQESTKRITINARRAGSATNLLSLITYISRRVVFGI